MTDILEKELSYKIQGCIYNVANKYGRGLKEKIYENALIEELNTAGLKYEIQKRINIYSVDSGKVLGTYVPDIIVENKVIIELKASDYTTKENERQQQSYLKASEYEIAYLVNFRTPRLYIKRSIYTNDRKPFITQINKKAPS